MRRVRVQKWTVIAAVVIVVVGLAAIIGLGGCASGTGGSESALRAVSTTAGAATTIAAAAVSTTAAGESKNTPAMAPVYDSATGAGGDVTAQLAELQQAGGQKIISDAQIDIEVKNGQFQNAFAQALLVADRYGGYIVSSSSQASGEEGSLKSGTIAIRVPSTSFDNALNDAAKIGDIKNRQVQTQDVTEEYVDLQARIINSKAHVQAVLALMAKAKTVDEILQVQQVLTVAQQELEQLEGRKRFLDEHTSFSTITMSIHEAGAVVVPATTWGITKAVKDGLHNLVDAFNAIVRGLGVLVPVLVVIAIIGYVIYRLWRAAVRRQRAREAARYQPYPEGWRGPGPGAPAPQAAGVSPAGRPEAKE
ncbi:MAG: DUF4349 domain-containing protein [Actinobacteria bacterium]|nr:DUF4349 domain-containing protein [Actinomycetota bacterium]